MKDFKSVKDPVTLPEPATPEPFITLKEAAEILKLPYFKIQRAAKEGTIPTYRLFNGRPLVRLTEIIIIIERTRLGDFR